MAEGTSPWAWDGGSGRQDGRLQAWGHREFRKGVASNCRRAPLCQDSLPPLPGPMTPPREGAGWPRSAPYPTAPSVPRPVAGYQARHPPPMPTARQGKLTPPQKNLERAHFRPGTSDRVPCTLSQPLQRLTGQGRRLDPGLRPSPPRWVHDTFHKGQWDAELTAPHSLSKGLSCGWESPGASGE